MDNEDHHVDGFLLPAMQQLQRYTKSVWYKPAFEGSPRPCLAFEFAMQYLLIWLPDDEDERCYIEHNGTISDKAIPIWIGEFSDHDRNLTARKRYLVGDSRANALIDLTDAEAKLLEKVSESLYTFRIRPTLPNDAAYMNVVQRPN